MAYPSRSTIRRWLRAEGVPTPKTVKQRDDCPHLWVYVNGWTTYDANHGREVRSLTACFRCGDWKIAGEY